LTVRPGASNAEVHVLFEGYTGPRTACTVALIRDGDVLAVWDPGMVPGPTAILEPLEGRGVAPAEVTDVVLSHHHPDHTMNAGLFPNARVHDYWAFYRGDEWIDRPAEGFEVSPSVRLLETPGHTPQCITALAGTGGGVVALTHLWWRADGPTEDPYATDPEALHSSRRRVLGLADLVVPGHGAMFRPDGGTPR
jgi:glyoxylase-like metal-dependent hydrolase (beta-lactamase superfamily II)